MYGENDVLYPKDPKKRATVDQRLHFDTENLFPKVVEAVVSTIGNPRMYNSISISTNFQYPILFRGRTVVPNNLRENIKRSYGFLEKFLRKNVWLAGSDLTIADLCCVSSISTLDYLVPISREYEKLSQFLEKCKQLSYYQEANQMGLDMLGTKIQERLIETYIRNLTIR